ncbi:hypothetical protein EJB05_53142, partial [Eragrostis curvula]
MLYFNAGRDRACMDRGSDLSSGGGASFSAWAVSRWGQRAAELLQRAGFSGLWPPTSSRGLPCDGHGHLELCKSLSPEPEPSRHGILLSRRRLPVLRLLRPRFSGADEPIPTAEAELPLQVAAVALEHADADVEPELHQEEEVQLQRAELRRAEPADRGEFLSSTNLDATRMAVVSRRCTLARTTRTPASPRRSRSRYAYATTYTCGDTSAYRAKRSRNACRLMSSSVPLSNARTLLRVVAADEPSSS